MLSALPSRARTALFLCVAIMSVYTIEQTMVILSLIEPSYNTALFGFFCILFFIPSFAIFATDFWIMQKQMKQTFDDKMQAINASNIVVVLDAKGNILKVNENFCNLTGYSKQEVEGLHHARMVRKDVARSKEYREFWKKLRKGQFVKDKFERISKDGSSIWIQGSYSPIRNGTGGVYQVIKIATDITKEYEAQIELQHKNVYLEHAAKILRHDMHSGINTYIPRGIKGLERRVDSEKIKELKIESSLKLIKEGLNHAQRVYRGVYEFTNLVKKDSILEKQNHCLTEILTDYLSKTAYSDQVAIGQMPSVCVNEPLFCTAVDNLIRNGLKYNDSEFKMVAVTMLDEDHIAIIDNGRGMSQEEFERFCKPYERRAGQKESGTGLGLNISVAIFKEHGFDVNVEKQENGTIVKVKLNDKINSACG
jgi:PAS domain S-box-containing protein